MTVKKYDAHEYANLFPMMTAVELEALAADVKENGQRHPIVRYKGTILDGRNRLKACEMAGVEPVFSEYEGDDAGALAMVISLNVQRRDLMAAQKAIVAARTMPMFEAIHLQKRGGDTRRHSGKSSPNAGRSREDAAKVFKVSDKSVQQAKALLLHAPDLVAEVEACATSLAEAYATLVRRQGEEQARQQEAERKARDAARNVHYREAVSNGEMTLDEALEKARSEARQEEEKQRQDAEARGLWASRMLQVCTILRESVAERTDAHLQWYTEPGAPGADVPLTLAQVDEAVKQLNRVRSITFKSEG